MAKKKQPKESYWIPQIKSQADLVAEAQPKSQVEEWLAKQDLQSYEGAYLNSVRWRRLRALVLKRAKGLCEGCGEANATEVHHLSYNHIGDEFLWELVAVCRKCHEKTLKRNKPWTPFDE